MDTTPQKATPLDVACSAYYTSIASIPGRKEPPEAWESYCVTHASHAEAIRTGMRVVFAAMTYSLTKALHAASNAIDIREHGATKQTWEHLRTTDPELAGWLVEAMRTALGVEEEKTPNADMQNRLRSV